MCSIERMCGGTNRGDSEAKLDSSTYSSWSIVGIDGKNPATPKNILTLYMYMYDKSVRKLAKSKCITDRRCLCGWFEIL